MTIVLAIPMHLLALPTAVAECAATTTEFAILALEVGTTSAADVPQLTQLMLIREKGSYCEFPAFFCLKDQL